MFFCLFKESVVLIHWSHVELFPVWFDGLCVNHWRQGFLMRLRLHSDWLQCRCGFLNVSFLRWLLLLLWAAQWAQVAVFPLKRRKGNSCHCQCETPKTNQWVPFVCKPKRRNKLCLILFLIETFDFSQRSSLSTESTSKWRRDSQWNKWTISLNLSSWPVSCDA